GQRVRTILQQGERVWHYDLSHRLLYESDGEGQVMARYIYAGSLLVARVNAAGESQFYHFDKTGNTLALTDEKGQVVMAYAYSPFGEITAQSGQPENNPFTFVGEHGVVDDGNGLYFMQTRHYDSLTGRFIQRDPIGLAGGLNLYTYALNNPVTTIDPKGMLVVELLAVLTAAGVLLTGDKIGHDMKNGVIGRSLKTAGERIRDPENITPQDVKDRIGPNPGEQAVKEIFGALGEGGAAIITSHPIFEIHEVANIFKTIYDVSQGDFWSVWKSQISHNPLGKLGKAVDVTEKFVTAVNRNSRENCQPPSKRTDILETSKKANKVIRTPGATPYDVLKTIFYPK
ncbi:MAG: RHS repeat-associated core domain-containing protein, partial [Candidatus Contubernalis sp.]|nr:RHS repeat-associated core domain-containing protein [Candidatus Contubernalis sp.]